MRHCLGLVSASFVVQGLWLEISNKSMWADILLVVFLRRTIAPYFFISLFRSWHRSASQAPSSLHLHLSLTRIKCSFSQNWFFSFTYYSCCINFSVEILPRFWDSWHLGKALSHLPKPLKAFETPPVSLISWIQLLLLSFPYLILHVDSFQGPEELLHSPIWKWLASATSVRLTWQQTWRKSSSSSLCLLWCARQGQHGRALRHANSPEHPIYLFHYSKPFQLS